MDFCEDLSDTSSEPEDLYDMPCAFEHKELSDEVEYYDGAPLPL